LVLVVAAVVLLVAGSVVAYVVWNGQAASSTRTISTWLTKGAQSDYGYGGSVSFGFNLSSTRSLLRGAFATNTSLILYVMTSDEYAAWRPGSTPGSWYYTTGNIRGGNVSVSLSAGDWFMLLDFVNDTGRVVHTSNGTSILSVTHLSITQTFTVAPESSQSASMVLSGEVVDHPLAGSYDTRL
jgi:hypothetical protein